MADAQDLKSWDLKSRVGSSPATGTNLIKACINKEYLGFRESEIVLIVSIS